MHVRLFIAAAATAAFALGPAHADDLVFMLDNQSSDPLRAFYASPVGVESWEDDILGQDILPAGEALRITIPDGGEVCDYDLRFEYESGDMEEDREVDLCETGSYTLVE